ncbi:MAG TPA: sigma-70 family RNA polymerase sigma factor, partial [Solirubrobacteraceae bacterium]
PPLAPAVVHRYLASTTAHSIAKKVLRKLVPKEQVEDLATDTLVRALKAPPPHTEAVLPGWFAQIARRRAIDWLRKTKRRKKYEGPMPVHVAREDDYTGQAIDTGDAAAISPSFSYDPSADADPAKLLGDELDHFIGDHARDREVREMIREHSDDGKTYAEIAAARGLTPAQVANRILRFKVKYSARVQRRRQILFGLALLKAAGWAAAILLSAFLAWYLLRRGPDDIRPDPSRSVPSATPSASASAPVFLQALPPPPEPSFAPDKPQPPRLKP